MECKQEILNEHKCLTFRELYIIDHQNYDIKCEKFIKDNHLTVQFGFYYDTKIKKTRNTPIKQQSYIMELGHFKQFIQSLSHSYYNCQDIFNDIERRRKNTSNYYKKIATERKEYKKANKQLSIQVKHLEYDKEQLTIQVKHLETQVEKLKNDKSHVQNTQQKGKRKRQKDYVKVVFSYSKSNIPNIK